MKQHTTMHSYIQFEILVFSAIKEFETFRSLVDPSLLVDMGNPLKGKTSAQGTCMHAGTVLQLLNNNRCD